MHLLRCLSPAVRCHPQTGCTTVSCRLLVRNPALTSGHKRNFSCSSSRMSEGKSVAAPSRHSALVLGHSSGSQQHTSLALCLLLLGFADCVAEHPLTAFGAASPSGGPEGASPACPSSVQVAEGSRCRMLSALQANSHSRLSADLVGSPAVRSSAQDTTPIAAS